MKHLVLLTALVAPYALAGNGDSGFVFDIPQQTVPSSKTPGESKATITVVKPNQVEVSKEPTLLVKPPAAKAPAVASTPSAAPGTAPSAALQAPPKVAAQPTAPVPAQAALPSLPSAKENYRVETVTKAESSKVGKPCAPSTIAMTFHNVPTQKGPYFHRWVSLGCAADEVQFVREGNEQYKMHWKLAYIPADAQQVARYALTWNVVGKDDKGAQVDYAASHTFTLDNPRTLSLTNNMAVSLRKVP